MFYTPHKLYLVANNPTQKDENGNPIAGTGRSSRSFLCDCFLHDVDTWMKRGFSGLGISVSYYVNMERRNDLKVGQEVKVYEDGNLLRGQGMIVDIKSTGGMQSGGTGNYTTIYF